MNGSRLADCPPAFPASPPRLRAARCWRKTSIRWSRRPWSTPSIALPPRWSASKRSAAWNGSIGVLFGAGPTTGLVVDSSGYILSSAFNFVNKPASILVRLPDGTRKPAKLVARDHNCQLVLLKIEPDHPLPVPEAAPQSEMRVGQWCVAVGRTFEEIAAQHGRGHSQRRGPGVGQGPADRRPRFAQQLRRSAGRYPRPRDGPARAALAAVGRGNRRRRMVRFGHRLRRAAGGHPEGPPQAPQGRGPLLRRGGRLHAIEEPLHGRHRDRLLPAELARRQGPVQGRRPHRRDRRPQGRPARPRSSRKSAATMPATRCISSSSAATSGSRPTWS